MNRYAFPILALSLIVNQPAFAQDGPRVDFAYSAKELETPEGRTNLLARLELTARQSCKSSSALISLRAERDCAEELAQEFVELINNKPLSKLVASTNLDRVLAALR